MLDTKELFSTLYLGLWETRLTQDLARTGDLSELKTSCMKDMVRASSPLLADVKRCSIWGQDPQGHTGLSPAAFPGQCTTM